MTPIKVQKTPILGMDTDSPDSEIKPGFFRAIYNALPRDGFGKTGLQNVNGTVELEHDELSPLPSGTNTCIGAFSDKPGNRIFYFIHNSNDDHGVWYFSPDDNTHTLVMQTEFLNFSLPYPITSCDFIGEIIQWTDANNEPRSIIVNRAVDGDLYDFTDQTSFEKQCSLYKVAAKAPPTISIRTAGTTGTNNISSESFQFCTMFVYHDNSCSDVSPLSVLSPADVFPATTNIYNRIVVTQSVEDSVKGVIKSVYFLFVKNSSGDFFLFREVEGTGASSYSVNFEGNDTVEVILASSVNFIPRKAQSVLFHDQRSILNMSEYDYEDWDDFTLSVSKTSRASSNKICAPNASYTVGIIFHDKFGRTNGIIQEKSLTFGNIKKTKGTYTITNTEQLHIAWTLSGNPPPWADSYAICLKRNNTFSNFYKGIAFVMFYLKDGDDTDDTFQIRDDGKIFGGKAPSSWTKQLYWKLPANLPFSIDNTYKLRLLSECGQTIQVENIVGVYGDKIVTESFGLSGANWATILGGASGPYGMMNIAIERSKTEPDKTFYEVGEHFDCSDGTFSMTSGTIPGEFHYVDSKYYFNPFDAGNTEYGGTYGDALQPSAANTTSSIISLPVITSTPTHASVSIQDVSTTIRKASRSEFLDDLHIVVGAVATAFGYGATNETKLSLTKNLADDAAVDERRTDIASVRLVYTPDLNKSASDFGRPWSVVRNKRINQDPNLLSISDPFVTGSNINGINKFRNLYSIPTNRTPITKLVNIDAGNLFLAIHKRTTTSLATYAGGNVLHTSDGTQIFGDAKSIIGYEREMLGNYGSIYPDSIIAYKGKVYWFDPYSGEFLRYRNGIAPIGSLYKMHNFFKTKGDQFIDPTGRNVICGYDGNLDILYVTFKSTDQSEERTVAFIDREGEERWYSFEEFLPERYAYINERLFAFVDGELWEHNVNNTRNLFYGSQKTTRLTHIFNTDYSKEKIVRSVGLEGNAKWDAEITVPKLDKTDQLSHLYKSNFVRKDDMYYADLRRDENTLPAPAKPLLQGHILMGKTYTFDWENDSDEEVTLDSINYSYIESTGHRIN